MKVFVINVITLALTVSITIQMHAHHGILKLEKLLFFYLYNLLVCQDIIYQTILPQIPVAILIA